MLVSGKNALHANSLKHLTASWKESTIILKSSAYNSSKKKLYNTQIIQIKIPELVKYLENKAFLGKMILL